MVIEKEITSKYIPLHIIQTILLLQPSKSLQRFKTVCKSWYAIISDPEFAQNHLQQSKKNSKNQNIFLCKSLRDERYHVARYENSEFHIETTWKHRYARRDLLCSGDGLVLLKTSSLNETYLLWNPCSKQKTWISRAQRFHHRRTTFGLCRGPSLNDYKIVAKSPRYYAVYSCKNKVWTERNRIFPCIRTTHDVRKKGLFVDGFYFWVTREKLGHIPEIIYFDPRDDKFNKLQNPEKINTMAVQNFDLISLRGCLCLYDNWYGLPLERLRIWILKDNDADSNCWTELMIIKDTVRGIVPLDVITPLFFTKKNELVTRFGYGFSGTEIGIYNSKENNFDKRVFSNFTQNTIVVPCLDTLFFPTTSNKSRLTGDRTRRLMDLCSD